MRPVIGVVRQYPRYRVVAMLVAMFFRRPNSILILVALLAAPQVWKAVNYNASAPENAQYYGMSVEPKISYGALYIALAVYLAVMSHDVHEILSLTSR